MSAATSLDALWEPITINGLEIRNRLFASAHLMAFDDEPIVGDRYIDYYEERARGGLGLLVTGAEGVHPTGWHPPHFQAWKEEAAPRYRELSERVEAHGAKIFTQLWHCGLQDFGTMVLENQHPVLGPSGIPSPIYGRIAKAMEQHEIREIVEAFGQSAEIARESGIHGVEVGGAHGYLISSFLSSFNNQRTDEYGGSLENRCRLAAEVGREIRARVGDDYPVGFRMNFEEFVGPGGFEPDQCEELLAEIHRHHLYDYISITGGTYHSMWGFVMPSTSPFETPNVPNAVRAKRVVNGEVPIMMAQKVTTVETAAEIVTAGQADLVAMTRAHLADPEVVRKAREGREREIRRCVGFNQGCVHRMLTGGMVTCTVNPVVGREAKWGRDHVSRTASPQNVVVVGGGPAGLKFAESAGQRGHRVRLLEREGELGGQLRYAAMLPGRERWMHLSEDLEVSLDRLGVEVELGVEATAQDIIDDGADLVVVATGSHFATSGFSVFRQDRLGIPGADSSAVIDPVAAIRDPSAVGDSVVVIDEVGDTAGLGVAELLGLAGKEVHIVTMSPMVGQALASTFEVPSVLYPKLVAAGVEFHVWTTVESIGDGVASLRQVWTGEASDVDADTIVMNTHRVPEESLYRQLAEAGIQVRRIGDCVAPRQVDEAIYEAVALGFELQDSLVTQRPATLTGS